MPKDAARPRDPIKLVRRSGQWSIEFNRLVAVDDQIMRPERCHVAATGEVLRALAPGCPPERVREVDTLMQQPDDGNERVFELDEDGWVPVSGVTNSQRPPSRAEMMALIADLQTQLTLMRGLHDALITRIVAMEAAIAKPPAEPEPLKRTGRRVPSRRDMLAVLQGPGPLALDGLRPPEPSPAHAATAAAEPPILAAAAASPAAEAPVPVAAPEAAPADAGPDQGPKTPAAASLVLPSSGDVIHCLKLLAPDVVVAPESAGLPADFSDCFVARLVDAADEALGVILINQRAGAALGGGLLGIPLAARDEQARRGIAKDTLEGLNEICNNIVGLLNRKNPKGYAKLRPLERVNAATLPWLAKPATTLGLATPPNGALWLAAR
jgi:hypothetical protein